MVPTAAMLDRLQTILSADTGSLAAITALHVHLAKAAFNPAGVAVPADLTEADFAGYAVVSAGIGTAQTFIDPLTGLRVIQLLEPAGGWHWQSTGAVSPSQTIFGYYVTDNANAVLWGSATLNPTPVISGTGQAVDVPQVRFSMPPSALV